MAKRKIIEIDEALCTGCGDCVTGCAEGALAVVDGKARLLRESYCDGFGDCIGECPTGALRIVEREAPAYDEEQARRHVAETGGDEAVRRFDRAARTHAGPPRPAGGCPGTRVRTLAPGAGPAAAAGTGLPEAIHPSELRQWPVQLHLVPADAPFFRGRELVVMNSCGALASADVHWRFLRGRSVVIGCPKLDRTQGYVEKLAAILSEPSLPAVRIVRMEVPCCGGLTAMVREAAARSGRADLVVEETVLSLDGRVLPPRPAHPAPAERSAP